MERERSAHIFSKRSDFRKDFSTLEEINTKLLEEQKNERKKWRRHQLPFLNSDNIIQ